MLRYHLLVALVVPSFASAQVDAPAVPGGRAQEKVQGREKGDDKTTVEMRSIELIARVVDAAGKPIAGAGLRRFDTDTPKDSHLTRENPTAKSDADGRIKLVFERDPKKRVYWLLAAKKRTALSLNARETKATVEGKEVWSAKLGDIVMHDGASILGLIRGVDGKPIAGAKVTATDVLTEWTRNTVRSKHATTCYGVSDAKGRVRLSGVPKHGVRIAIKAKGFYSWDLDYLNRHTPLVATLQKGGSVKGFVLDESGKPVEKAYVRLSSEASARVHSVRTKEDGKFEFTLPGKGRYMMYFQAQLDGGTQYTSDKTKILSGARANLILQFGTGEVAEEEEEKDDSGKGLATAAAKKLLAARAGARPSPKKADKKSKDKFKLLLIDAKTGVALRKARGTAAWWPPNQFSYNQGYLERQLARAKATDLDERGTLKIAGPRGNQPPTGRILVSAAGYAPMLLTDIEFDEDGKNEKTVKMQKESVIAGVVVDQKTGAPLEGVKVVAFSDPSLLQAYNPPPMRRKLDGNTSTVTTDAKGAFRLGELAAGTVSVYVSHKERADIAPIEVDLENAETKSDVRIEYPTGGSLRGTITGVTVQAGCEVRIRRMQSSTSHARVWYSSSSNQSFESAKVQSDGSFAFQGLSRSNYLLALVIPFPNRKVEVEMEPIRMRSKDLTRTFDVSEDLPGRLSGFVKLEGAAVTPGRLMLIATQANSNVNRGFSMSRPQLEGEFVTIDPSGKFDLPIAEGIYQLRVVDLATKLTLFQSVNATSVWATKTTDKNITVNVASVTLRLVPEEEGSQVAISKIEIIATHATPAQARGFGMIMGNNNYYTGVGKTLEPGQTEVQLVLPAVPCKLLARSDAHNLDPNMHQHNFPAQGEVELTPVPGQSNKIEMKVSEPQIDAKAEKGVKAAKGAVLLKAIRALPVQRKK